MRPASARHPETLHDAAQADAMRRAGRLVAAAHRAVAAAVAPGVSTRELDAIAEAVIREGGGTPAFKGFQGFPATACISVNEEVVHGLPSRRRLAEGDVVAVDLGAIVDGHYGDAAVTHGVGAIAPEAARLLAATRASLLAGIAAARPGAPLEAVSAAIQDAAEAAGLGLVREWGGHGIGRVLHGWPHVPNLRTGAPGPVLEAGRALAIEPMATLGDPAVRVKKDGWTVVTRDGSLAAHFEHTVLITPDGPEVLTA